MGREQRVELLDAAGQVIDEYLIKDFSRGRYLVLNAQGLCAVRITRLKGSNAVLNGIFWDPAPAELNAPAPVPLQGALMEEGTLRFTLQGQPGQRVCVDISENLRSWECVATNTFQQPLLHITRPANSAVPAEFVRTHFVEE